MSHKIVTCPMCEEKVDEYILMTSHVCKDTPEVKVRRDAIIQVNTLHKNGVPKSGKQLRTERRAVERKLRKERNV